MSSVLTEAQPRPGPAAFVQTRPELAPAVVVAILTAAAFALRVSQIDQSLLGDEVFTYQDVVRHGFGSVVSTVHVGGENSPPLYFLLAWIASKLGNPSVWIRLPSLLLGTATVPLAYLLGREAVGRTAGVIGAAVLALAPFAVYYGVEARPYATMTFFAALSTLALLRALDTRSRWWWALYALSAAAAAYSHYTSVFVLGVQAAWCLWTCRRHVRDAVLANSMIVVLYLPWLPHVRGKLLGVIGLLYPLSVHRVLTDLLRPVPGHPAAPLRAIPTRAGLIAFGACLLAGAVALGRSRLRRRDRATPIVSRRELLLLLLAAATPVGLLLYSLLVSDLWLPRGLSASLPAAAIVIGALLAALPRPLLALATVLVAATLLVGTFRSFEPAYDRGPFRTIASYLDRVAGVREPIAILSLGGQPAMIAQFQKPHELAKSLAALWANTPSGSGAYLVVDLTFARFRYPHLGIPRHPGFVLLGAKHYAGSLPVNLLSYRRIR